MLQFGKNEPHWGLTVSKTTGNTVVLNQETMSTRHQLSDNNVKLPTVESDSTAISCTCQHSKSAISCLGSSLLNIISTACLALLH